MVITLVARAINENPHPPAESAPRAWLAGEGNFRWRNRAWNVISVTDRWVLQTGWWRSDGTEKRDYVLVEAEGMDGGATAVELYLGVDGWILGKVMA